MGIDFADMIVDLFAGSTYFRLSLKLLDRCTHTCLNGRDIYNKRNRMQLLDIRRKAIVIAAGAFTLITTPCNAEGCEGSMAGKIALPQNVGFSPERLARLNSAFKSQVDSGRYAGIGYVILRHGRIVACDNFGDRNLANKAPMTSDTIMRAMSMSKPVTGVAMLILHDEGKWHFDDPVSKYIPEFANLKVMTTEGQIIEPSHPMTMRELITSTGGIASPMENPKNARNIRVNKLYIDKKLRAGSIGEMVAKIAKIPLAFQPGTEFQYGISHDVQGYIVEKITGMPFDRFLKERVFRPLSMNDTDFHVPRDKRTRLSELYDYDSKGKLHPIDGPFGPAPMEQPAYISGAAGLFTTMADYQRFAQMLLNGGELDGTRILSPHAVELMSSDLLPEGVKLHFYQHLEGQGYGVDVAVIKDPGRASFSSGLPNGSYFWSGAHGTFFWVDPANDITVVGMTQQNAAAFAHMGLPTLAPDLRALAISLVYAALIDRSK